MTKSSPSNNLKEQIFTLLGKSSGFTGLADEWYVLHQEQADQILTLTIDSILARPEVQLEKIDYSYVNVPEEWRADQEQVDKETRNNLRADFRAMLEEMKHGS